jgi:branched-chain amino acid aminotransferase
MIENTLETIRQNDLHHGYVRLVVTRGVGSLGLSPSLCPKASVFIIAAAISLYPDEAYEKGLIVVTTSTRRIGSAALPPTVKSLNYLNNILAKIEANNAGAGEGLMLNEQGYVAECTGDNIFAIKNGKIITPSASAGALCGITRQTAIDICGEFDIPVSEPQITRYDLYTADEIFLTGTAAEVIPVIKLDARTIGDGTPGPITKRLITRFRELANTTGTPIYS